MPKFVIERDMPGVGKLSPDELSAAAKKSAGVMREMGTIHWVETYVTDDKIYCVYVAPDEDTIRRHANSSGLPADRVSAVRKMADATTAE